MHLIIDIRSASPVDTFIAQYASNWVDIWKSLHPEDRITYIHFGHQKSPENGKSIIVKWSWYGHWKSISIPWSKEIFRCINFSSYSKYDAKIVTISHIFDHANNLYPWVEKSWLEWIVKKHIKNRIRQSWVIIVPSLIVGQETVDILSVREDNIEIIPYVWFEPIIGDRKILNQLSISGPYWLYNGTYWSEANIYGLLKGYKQYRELGWSHILILIWQPIDAELRNISDLIQKMNLTGYVRIIGLINSPDLESLYAFASGWVYVGAYYASGPHIELAQNYWIPLLISDIPSLIDYHLWAITIHPNHLGVLWESLRRLEHKTIKQKKKVSNIEIMKAYEKIISENR
jgi:hypothetical protein